MPRRRLGVAVLVPPPLAREIDGLRRGCGDRSFDRVPPHLTLVPPVNVRVERFSEALTLLDEAAAAVEPFTLELGPPASFLPDGPTLYLEVGGDRASLEKLRARVFRPPLERPLRWDYVPHVTLADEIEPGRIEAAVTALADYRAELVVERVDLLEETVHGDGHRRWASVADARLGG